MRNARSFKRLRHFSCIYDKRMLTGDKPLRRFYEKCSHTSGKAGCKAYSAVRLIRTVTTPLDMWLLMTISYGSMLTNVKSLYAPTAASKYCGT